MQLTDSGTLQYVQIEDLKKPVTDRPIYQLRIVCTEVPLWPINFQPNLERVPPSGKLEPITLGEVLAKIYYCMRLPIQKEDWYRLGPDFQTSVLKAYQRRCRLSGAAAEEEKLKGVKRIDFCGTKVWFRELIRMSAVDGIEVMNLDLWEGSS